MSIEKPPRAARHSRVRSVIEEIGKIKIDRTPTVVSDDPEYRELLPLLKEFYARTEYWHGTGRYKYGETGEIEDIVRGVLQDRGLRPHEDDWDQKRGLIHTVSAAPSRMYARLYAGMYCPAATRIENELGTRELWGYYFFGTSGLAAAMEYRPTLSQLRKGDPDAFVPNLLAKTERWGGKISVQKHSFKDIFLNGTDIAENYPVLIAIQKGAVTPTHGSRFINLHEVRSESAVPLDAFSHLEVPRDRVAETRSILADANQISVPVIPIEFGEEYCRNFTLRKLVSGKPLALHPS